MFKLMVSNGKISITSEVMTSSERTIVKEIFDGKLSDGVYTPQQLLDKNVSIADYEKTIIESFVSQGLPTATFKVSCTLIDKWYREAWPAHKDDGWRRGQSFCNYFSLHKIYSDAYFVTALHYADDATATKMIESLQDFGN